MLRKGPKIAIPNIAASFEVTNSGTFCEGDFRINRAGLTIGTGTPSAVRRLSGGSDCHGEEPSTCSAGQDELDAELCSSTLEDLQLLAVVGSGSSGVVRRVIHKRTGTMLVLKEIPFNVSCSELRKAIKAELRTMYGSAHPHIVRFYQSFFRDGSVSILMENCAGGSLADVLKTYQRLSEPVIAAVARQVLLGFVYLHKTLRIVHRDIKPSNLLLSESGAVKIADFGVSSQVANTVAGCMSWVGTVTYMSPERISGSAYSFDSDIWSLGLTLVECATGQFPYARSGAKLSFWDIMDAVVNSPPPALDPEQASPEICAFVAACLRKQPAERLTAAQLLEHPFIRKYETQPADLRKLAARG